MKAIVYTEYGPPEVLQLKEVEKPVPRDNDVLIRMHATTANTGDANARGFVFVPSGFGFLPRLMFGLRRPKKTILGTDLAGEIEAVGKNVTLFKEGDKVFGTTGARLGAYAEYVCLPEDAVLALMPANVTYEEAAAIFFGAHTALVFLRDKGNIRSGHDILVNGASGTVGTFAVQLARYFGARVTGVCSTANVELVKSLGADRVIDYTQDDFTQRGETYDAILDVVGEIPFSRLKGSLKEHGVFLAVEGGVRELFLMIWTSLKGVLPFMQSGKKVAFGPAAERKEDLLLFKDLVEAGKLRAVIDKIYPLEQTAEAHRYIDKGHKKGNVVITLGQKKNLE